MPRSVGDSTREDRYAAGCGIEAGDRDATERLAGMLFDTNPVNLSQLLIKARTGEIQLPDFQRPWKWDDERIMSLLATVALGYRWAS